MQKRKSIKRAQKKHDTLREALNDIELKLKELKKQRILLESTLEKTSADMTSTQSQELKLRNKLSVLIERESKLNQKKSDASGKLDKLKEKLNQISKIEEEIKEVR